MPGSKIKFTSILHMAFELVTLKVRVSAAGRAAVVAAVSRALAPAVRASIGREGTTLLPGLLHAPRPLPRTCLQLAYQLLRTWRGYEEADVRMKCG